MPVCPYQFVKSSLNSSLYSDGKMSTFVPPLPPPKGISVVLISSPVVALAKLKKNIMKRPLTNMLKGLAATQRLQLKKLKKLTLTQSQQIKIF